MRIRLRSNIRQLDICKRIILFPLTTHHFLKLYILSLNNPFHMGAKSLTPLQTF